MQYQNYKSDFVLRESFVDITGKPVPLPDVDFTLRYWTKHGHWYIASRQDGVYKNCAPEGDTLLVFFKSHNLCEGKLHHELHLALDNAAFEDGTQNVYYPAELQILLWDKASSTEKLVSDLMADYTRGNAFVFSDFTPEQIEELQKPAMEAAEDTKKVIQLAEAAIQDTEDYRAMLQSLIDRAQYVVAGVPTGMEVESPAFVTIGNPSKPYELQQD